MLLNNFANAGRIGPDHIVIGGKVLELDTILNEAFFVPDKIKELSETFRHNTPFPHFVVEGLFSPVLLELMAAMPRRRAISRVGTQAENFR
jgi:hypothetical protein